MLKVEYREIKATMPLSGQLRDRMSLEQIVMVLMLDPDLMYSVREATISLYPIGDDAYRAEHRMRNFVDPISECEDNKDDVREHNEPKRWYGYTYRELLTNTQLHMGMKFMEMLRERQEEAPGEYYLDRNRLLGPFKPEGQKKKRGPKPRTKTTEGAKSAENAAIVAEVPLKTVRDSSSLIETRSDGVSSVSEEQNATFLSLINESHQMVSEEPTNQGPQSDLASLISGSDQASQHNKTNLIEIKPKRKRLKYWALGAVAAIVLTSLGIHLKEDKQETINRSVFVASTLSFEEN